MPKHRLCVGVDIGASSIKICQLKPEGSALRLVKLASHPLPPETIVDGALMSSSKVVDGLRALFAENRIKEQRVAVAVSGHSIIIKKLSLPMMDRAELEATIELEAENLIPFDIKDVYFDVQTLPHEPAPQGQMRVLFVAAKKDYVHEYTSVLAEAGLKPVVCDVDPFALETAFVRAYSPSEQASTAVINIGAAKTTLNILAGAHSGLTRDLAIGGNMFTEGLQRTLKVSFEQAERYKLGQQRDSSGATQANRVSQVLIETCNLLADELQASFDIFGASDARGVPRELYVAGGSSHMPGLEGALKRRLGIEVHPFDPFRNLETSSIDPQLLLRMRKTSAIAVGLAMRYVGDS